MEYTENKCSKGSFKESGYDSQLFQRGLNVWHLEKDGLVRNLLVVEHHADTPYNRREADILGASQVVQDDLMLDVWYCHVARYALNQARLLE